MGEPLSEARRYEIVRRRQALEELAIEFQKQTQQPLGFFPAFVQAKQLLREAGIELPARES
jgi:hypothetical protein